MSKKYEANVPGNPEITRWSIFCPAARRKGGKDDFHTTVEMYDTETAEQALERFRTTYEYRAMPRVREVHDRKDED